MTQFLKVKTAEEVLSIIASLPALSEEAADLDLAHGRVLSRPVEAPEPVPHFPRATMDGFAVRARDTFGASESLPALLEVSGEVLMGREPDVRVESGRAAIIATGGMLPEGADAVVMVEHTQPLDERTIEVTRPVAPGENVLQVGDDLARGREALAAGRRLRPQDLGVLAALGVKTVQVVRRPRVAVVSTGDEIVPADTASLPKGKVRDINTCVIAAQVAEAGGEVGRRAIIIDDLDRLAAFCRDALEDHDVLLLSGGSSVGSRDHTLNVLDRLPQSELLAHGVAIRPGKPTILARVGSKCFWGLPGQPASAMIVFTAFVRPCLERLQGLRWDSTIRRANVRRAVLATNLPSVHGRADYVRVALDEKDGILVAGPVFGKSAMISTLSRADGFVVVPEHVEGFDAGSEVDVFLFAGG
jgi:molybdopterin molybdotransferase